jgi:hypothetical protein
LAAGTAQRIFSRGRRHALFLAPGDDYPRALARQPRGDRQPNALGRTRDQRQFIGKLQLHGKKFYTKPPDVKRQPSPQLNPDRESLLLPAPRAEKSDERFPRLLVIMRRHRQLEALAFAAANAEVAERAVRRRPAPLIILFPHKIPL